MGNDTDGIVSITVRVDGEMVVLSFEEFDTPLTLLDRRRGPTSPALERVRAALGHCTTPAAQRAALLLLLASGDEQKALVELVARSAPMLSMILLDPPPGVRDERWKREYTARVFARNDAFLALGLYLADHPAAFSDAQVLRDVVRSQWRVVPPTNVTWQQALDAARAAPRIELAAQYAKFSPLTDSTGFDTAVEVPSEVDLLSILFEGMFPRPRAAGSIEVDWTAYADRADGKHFVPSVRIRVEDSGGALSIASIEVGFHRQAWVEVRPDEDARWNFAKHCARVALLLEGQLRGHLGRAHLVTEIYRRAYDRVWTGKPSPFGRLLRPFLYTVREINDFGVPLVFGSGSILAEASGLPREEIERVLSEVAEVETWDRWSPPEDSGSRYGAAAHAFSQSLSTFVDSFFDAHRDEIVERWADVEHFGVAINDVRAGVKDRPWQAGALPAIHSFEAAKRVARHAVFHASFFHTWTNDQQWRLGGDPAIAALSTAVSDAPAEGESYDAWRARATPSTGDSFMQCLLADVLAHTSYGRWHEVRDSASEYPFLEASDRDVLAAFVRALDSNATTLRDAGIPIDSIRFWVAI